MFAVMFESHPRPGRADAYLDWRTRLGAELRETPGFVGDEYYRSVIRKGWVLSLSTWEDEKALVSWRTHPMHQAAQARGRDEVFVDYTLRTGQLTRDTGLPAGQMLREQRLDETAAGVGTAAVLVGTTSGAAVPTTRDAVELSASLGLDPDAAGLTSWDVYEAAPAPGHLLLRTVWRDATAAEAFETASSFPEGARVRQVRIIRYYSMYNRREAPQYYPAPRSPA